MTDGVLSNVTYLIVKHANQPDRSLYLAQQERAGGWTLICPSHELNLAAQSFRRLCQYVSGQTARYHNL